MLSEQHHEGPNVLNPATAMIGDQATCMVVGHFSRNCWAAVPAAKGKYFASWEQGLRLVADFKSSVLVAHFTIPKTMYIYIYKTTGAFNCFNSLCSSLNPRMLSPPRGLLGLKIMSLRAS